MTDEYLFGGGSDPEKIYGGGPKGGVPGEIYMFTKDGLFITKLSPGKSTGYHSGAFSHGNCIFAFRHPNGKIYVYAMDDLYGQILRYKIEKCSIIPFEGRVTYEQIGRY